MAEILSHDSYTVMPWKNGRGTTSQIAIDSAEAQFPHHFKWRVSSAVVVSNDPFSNFDDCRRALVVVEGNGLLLNDVELKPLVPYFFSGSEYIDCKLVAGPVVDVGIIFRAHEVHVDMKIIRANIIEIEECDGLQFLYLVKGEGTFLGEALKKGDTLKIESSEKAQIKGQSLVGVLISITGSISRHSKNKNF
ncbi:MAG: HutD family protein [Bdellovibrio sp.]